MALSSSAKMTDAQLVAHLHQQPFVLAPMAGITDHAFRSFMRKRQAGVVVTELVSSDGILYAGERSKKIMSFDHSQRPIGIQIFGDEPEVLARAAQQCEASECDFVDINFGCPVPKVTKKGGGSAMLKDLQQMRRVLRAVKSALSIPLTIKIRTGWDQSSLNADEVCRLAHDEGIAWVAIHGRTRAQGYAGLSDWDYIRQVKENSPVPVLGNGDIHTAAGALQRLKESGCDGVMIGRGCLKNPNIFVEAQALFRAEAQALFRAEAQALFRAEALDQSAGESIDHIYEELHEFLERYCDPRLVGLQLKKFASWYSAGYPGSSAFRKIIFQTKETQEILVTAKQFFCSMKEHQQLDTSQENFLMGGHG